MPNEPSLPTNNYTLLVPNNPPRGGAYLRVGERWLRVSRYGRQTAWASDAEVHANLGVTHTAVYFGQRPVEPEPQPAPEPRASGGMAGGYPVVLNEPAMGDLAWGETLNAWIEHRYGDRLNARVAGTSVHERILSGVMDDGNHTYHYNPNPPFSIRNVIE